MILVCLFLAAPEAHSDESDVDALAKKSQNPIGNLAAIPIEHNFNFKTGLEKRTEYEMSIQPVFPTSLGPDWNLISRFIQPVIVEPEMAPGMGKHTGLGDLTPQFFFTPVEPITLGKSTIAVGVGPNFLIPTATSQTLGRHRWGTGPSAIIVFNNGPWVGGAVVTSTFGVFSPSSHVLPKQKIETSSAQYFINFNMGNGWALSTNPTMTIDWAAKKGGKYTVPLGGGISRVFIWEKQPMLMSASAYYNVARPDHTSKWQLRFTTALLFPQDKK